MRELLGLSRRDKVVILCSDALGFSHANNLGVYQALREGTLNSARVVTPGPWIRHAVRTYRGEDVGISLTLTCDNEIFHLSPLTASPSLMDGAGGFPVTSDDLWSHADLDELRREARGQLERAIYWGFDISHIASFADSLVCWPEFFDVVLDLAIEYRLPIRLSQDATEDRLGYSAISRASQEGLVAVDQIIDTSDVDLAQYSTIEDAFEHLVSRVSPGVSEISFKLAVDTPEIRELSQSWRDEVSWMDLVMDKSAVGAALARYDIARVDYRTIRDLAQQKISRPRFCV